MKANLGVGLLQSGGCRSRQGGEPERKRERWKMWSVRNGLKVLKMAAGKRRVDLTEKLEEEKYGLLGIRSKRAIRKQQDMLDLDRILEDVKECRTVPEQDVQEMCLLGQEILIQEANIHVIEAPVVVCGDIHGQLHDLVTLFKIGGEPPAKKYLFLGDFVDRGFYSLETFLLLLVYKLKYPSRVYLIRGNHESRQITSVYGFYDECVRKYSSANVWRYCCELFDYLSLGAYILGSQGGRDGVFCVHGGLSPSLECLDEIRLIDRKQEVPHDGSMCDLLWSDPEKDIQGWALSPRGAGYLFGEAETNKFLHVNRLSLIARAHQLVMEGYRELFDGGLVTVWSAPNYCYRCGNVAVILRLDEALSREYTTFESSYTGDSVASSTSATPSSTSTSTASPGVPGEIPSKRPVVDYFL